MRHLSAIVIIVLLVILPCCKFFKGGKKNDALTALKAQQDSIRVADSIRKVQNDLLAYETAQLESARKAEEERLALEAKFKYNIIVGSFITPEYAKGLAEEYRKKGLDPKIIKVAGSRFELVSAEAFDNFRKAVARLSEYQDTVVLDAWMYIKK